MVSSKAIMTYSLLDLQKQVSDPYREYIGKMIPLDFNYIIAEISKPDL